MIESRSFSKPERSEECKGISSRISEDRIVPFEFPFSSSCEFHRDLVGIVTKMVANTQDKILLKSSAPGLVLPLLKFHNVTGVLGFPQINSGLQIC